MKKLIAFTLLIIATGCTRVPERLYNPTAIIRAELQDEKTTYTVYIKGIVLNDHDEKIYKNMKGSITIQNNDRTLLTLPFELEQLLPFQKVEINTEKKASEYEISPLLSLLRVSPEQLRVISEPVFTEEIPINPKLITFTITSYETTSIFDIIRGK
jgi:hypothetical protein